LTGPVNHGALFKVICFAQNPSAAMRGGFLRGDATLEAETIALPAKPPGDVSLKNAKTGAR
jgi:hypothetical protein